MRRKPIEKPGGAALALPLAVLSVFSFVSGWLQLPDVIAPVAVFTNALKTALPAGAASGATGGTEALLILSAIAAPLAGIVLAWVLYRPGRPARLAAGDSPVSRFLARGWGFDALYGLAVVRPYAFLARANRHDAVDLAVLFLAWSTERLSSLLSRLQSGMLPRYAAGILLGAVAALGLTLLFGGRP